MLGVMLERVREKAPLIHNITNYVTANDCANILLACGASPIMADDPGEVEEITAICHGLQINMGTLDARKTASMLAAGKKAGELGHPILLDPVGVGASRLRTDTAKRLLKEIPFTVIRGNMTEIRTLVAVRGILPDTDEDPGPRSHGVDALASDHVTKENLNQAVAFAKTCAAGLGAVIVITGAMDIVADSQTAYCIGNGHPLMGRVTGTGCQLSAVMAAYLAANPGEPLVAAAAAVCAMGLCGQMAQERMTGADGNASYGNYLIDAVYRLTSEQLEGGAIYEMR